MGSKQQRLTYQVIDDCGSFLLLATYCDGSYIGQSKGYVDRKCNCFIKIYPYKLITNIDALGVELKQTRHRDDIAWR